jgi:glucan biosynthesis protein C
MATTVLPAGPTPVAGVAAVHAVARGTGAEHAGMARQAWMDNLRVIVIAGVIVMHVSTAYILDIGWYYEERTASDVTEMVVAVITLPLSLFAMAVLFLVAGRLTATSLARKGPRSFWRGRLLRLGLPVVLFVVVVDPATSVLGRWGTGGPGNEHLGSIASYEFAHPQSGPMWFVVALLVFSTGYGGWRRVRPAGPTAPLRPANLVVAAAVIVGTTFVVRLMWPFAGDTPLALNLWEWPQMGVMFALGAVGEERGWLDPPPAWLAPACLRAGVVASVALLLTFIPVALSDNADPFLGGLHAQALAEPVCEATIAVAMSLWVAMWFSRHVIYDGWLARALGRASYPTYVLHAPVVVALSVALSGVAVAAEVKFVVVASVGVVASYALGWLVTNRSRGRRARGRYAPRW